MSWSVQLKMTVGSLALDVALSGDDTPTVLIGPNGSGKTTILRMIAGAYAPDSGRMELGDRLLFDTQTGIDLPPEARRVGYVPQGYGLFPHLDVLDNVAFGCLGQTPFPRRDQRRASAKTLLEKLGGGHLADRTLRGLSGGEQQRIALARALMVEPELLLFDEPLSALDVQARRELRTYLAQHLVEGQVPSLVVTHDVRDVRALGAVVVVMENGRVVQRGTVAELAAQPATPFVAEFFDVPMAEVPSRT